MRIADIAKDGALELNWMWLPTFISQNFAMMKELKKVWSEKFRGKEPTDGLLWQVHYFTIDWLAAKFPIPGLKEYLSAIKEVQQ